MPKQSGPEMYEEKCPSMRSFFKDVKGEVLFVIGGSGDITGAALRILQSLSNCEINILYIRPDVKLLPETKKKHEWVTFNILQEYARSGVFEQIILIDNSSVSDIVGEVSIVDYYDKINETVASIVHFINVFDNSRSIMSTFHPFRETSRIRTVGLVDVDTGEEKMLFPLDNVTEARYYYTIGGKSLKEDATLNNKIRSQMRGKDGRTSFGIFKTDYNDNFCYSLVCSREIVQF